MSSASKTASGFGPLDTSVKSGPTQSRLNPGDPVSDTSVIGNDLTLLGDKISIISLRKLRVDGDVRGNVHGKHIVITDGASVVGTVCAEIIEVHGTVRGSIRAVTVALAATAIVEGDIVQHKLSLAEGAQFDGRVIRPKDPAELMPVLDPEIIASGRA